MSTQSSAQPDLPSLKTVRVAVLVVLMGVLTILAAAVDPWMLVLMAGLGLAAFALAEQTPVLDPVWDRI